MSILDSDYIKEQAHKPCFWSEEYGFDVVAFTHAMEQNYSNRVGAKINNLKKENQQLRQRVVELETENAKLKKYIEQRAWEHENQEVFEMMSTEPPRDERYNLPIQEHYPERYQR